MGWNRQASEVKMVGKGLANRRRTKWNVVKGESPKFYLGELGVKLGESPEKMRQNSHNSTTREACF